MIDLKIISTLPTVSVETMADYWADNLSVMNFTPYHLATALNGQNVQERNVGLQYKAEISQ